MYKALLISFFCVSSTMPLLAQLKDDSIKTQQLQEVIIKAWQRRDIDRLPASQNGFIHTGKKNEAINLAGTNGNVAIKTARQLFAKVPGVFVYEMDGSGNQLNIATRGLDPHRSWEYNIRQNGVLTNSDMYGYPASHYSAPMESYERIELVRGTGSLQYGAQFGGMVNFITKKPDSTKALGFESINTVGSFGLLTSYNAISGTYKKFSYTAYYHRRQSKGYRDNSESQSSSQFIQLQYRATGKLLFQAELGRAQYQYQIPGPLTDSMFAIDPTMSTRKRNYFNPDIYIPSVKMDWIINNRTRLYVTASGLFGKRSSVQYDAFANIADTINALTGEYKNRQVDIDGFNSRTAEARITHDYHIGPIHGKFAGGIVYMNNDLHRRQLGKGSTGDDYDLTLVEGSFGRDLHFRTQNVALFAENTFQVGSRLSVSPGIRFENGISKMRGTIVYYPANELPNDIHHKFVLAGISAQFSINESNNLYGGISQAYRPVLFKDIVPGSEYERVDKNLENASGYNAELGVRGELIKHLQYDVSLFHITYNNRMGTLVLQDNNNQPYTYRTNIGDSRTTGAEIFVQYKFPLSNKLFGGLFTSTSYINAEYVNANVSGGTENKNISGNKVESVPEWITRSGLELLYQGFSFTLQYNYTASSFSDALNTVAPPASGARGIAPAHSLWDVNASLRTNPIITLRAGINNLFNKQYFTKRPTMYPGPGIWPGDGRNMYVTVGLKI